MMRTEIQEATNDIEVKVSVGSVWKGTRGAPLGDPSHKYPPNPDTRQMPTRACSQEPDIAVSCEALPVPGKYRSGCSQSSIGQSTRSPMKEPE